MKITCDIILDLIPLVKENAASEDSVNLVMEHLKSCESCKLEFESHTFLHRTEFDDKKIVSLIKKKLFLAMLALLLIGAFIGMALDKNSSSYFMPTIIVVLFTVFAGVILFKFEKGNRRVERFFIGRAIGTIIIFVLLGIYLLLKYWLHLF